MKKLATLAFFLFISSMIHAQESSVQNTPGSVTSRGYLGVTIGPAFAVGDYADDDAASNENASYAKTGINYSVDFGYRLGKRWGITASYRGGSNAIDEEAFAETLQDIGLGSPTVDADPYKYNAIMVGPMLSWGSSRFDFDLRLELGYGFGTLPEININNVYNQMDFSTESEKASGVGVLFGGGLRYHLSSKLSFLAQLNYFSMVLSPDDDSATGEEIEQPIDVVTIDLGIALRLK